MNVQCPFSLRLPIRFTHTDPAAFVFYPRYFEMFQATVEDWFTYGLGIRYADLIAAGFGLPTARTECEFMRPCRLGEYLELTVTLIRLGSSSVTIGFGGRVDGEERLSAKSTLVQISMSDGRPRPFDGNLRKRLEEYERCQAELPEASPG